MAIGSAIGGIGGGLVGGIGGRDAAAALGYGAEGQAIGGAVGGVVGGGIGGCAGGAAGVGFAGAGEDGAVEGGVGADNEKEPAGPTFDNDDTVKIRPTSAMEYQVQSGPDRLYRIDGRSLSEINSSGGFQPRGGSTDLETYVRTNCSCGFVSTSTSPLIGENTSFAKSGTYIDKTDGSQLHGIDVNEAIADNPFSHEQEFAVIDGIPSSAVINSTPILSPRIYGETMPNPLYRGGL